MKRGPTVGETGELSLVRMIRRAFPASRRDVILGIGHDAAAIRPGRGAWILTKDLLVEDVDFRREYPPFLVGRKSLAVNLSDAAAMGAEPAWALLGLGLPPELDLGWVKAFLRGFRAMGREHGLDLIGGDLSAARQIVVSVTVLAKASRIVGRGGARPGDRIWVSGSLGDAGLGFERIERGEPVPAGLRRAFLDPSPRVALGLELARLGLPSAMIDVSDGLSVDLAHLCAESGTGAVIETARIPLSAEAARIGGEKALDRALNAGEDFELLFTVKPTPRNEKALEALRRRHAITPIGRIVKGKGILQVFGDGVVKPLPARGYEHFREGFREGSGLIF